MQWSKKKHFNDHLYIIVTWKKNQKKCAITKKKKYFNDNLYLIVTWEIKNVFYYKKKFIYIFIIICT